MRRSVPVIALAAWVLSACGGSTPAPAAEPADEAAAEPAPAPAADEPAGEEPAAEEPAGATDEPVDGPAAELPTDDAAGSDAPPGEEPPPEPAEEPAPEPEFPWPDDGCSADNSPTPVAAAPGTTPVLITRIESANLTSSPLPDLGVRRINCAGGWVQLRNELPADRPLLVWFWAPH